MHHNQCGLMFVRVDVYLEFEWANIENQAANVNRRPIWGRGLAVRLCTDFNNSKVDEILGP